MNYIRQFSTKLHQICTIFCVNGQNSLLYYFFAERIFRFASQFTSFDMAQIQRAAPCTKNHP
jgi:hypothetical protein